MRVFPAGYHVHPAELYAIWLALEAYVDIGNFVSDSRVALALICERRGGLGQEIDWRLRRLEEVGRLVKLGWSDSSCEGTLRGDRVAKMN